MTEGLGRRDGLLLALLALAAAALHLEVLCGRTYFSGDLTHVNFAWRALSLEQLQRGLAPLWNPYAYFGLPLLGTMQTGVFAPLSLPFHIFGWTRGLAPFLALGHFAAAAFTYLWLRRLAYKRAACFAGAAAYGLGGYLVGFLQFPNIHGTVVWLPALLLFYGRRQGTAWAGACGLLAGYPPAWGVMAAASFPLAWAGEGFAPAAARRTLAGLALALVLSAVMLLPGARLAAQSSRRGGIPTAQRLNNSLPPGGWAAAARPDAARRLSFAAQTTRPQTATIRWTDGDGVKTFTFAGRYRDRFRDPAGARFTPWVSYYVGLFGAALALLGLWAQARRKPRQAAWAVCVLAGGALLVLGAYSAPSRWLWETLAPLKLMRGPARLLFVLNFALAFLAACGVRALKNQGRQRVAAAAALLLAAELALLGRGYYPTQDADYWRDGGAAAALLAEDLAGRRYFQETQAEAWSYLNEDHESPAYRRFQRSAWRAFRHKQFGTANAPAHLAAASGAYESLVPKEQRRAQEELGRAREQSRAHLLDWAGVRLWLAPQPWEGEGVEYLGRTLWHVSRREAAAGAYALARKDHERLGVPFAEAPADLRKKTLQTLRLRPDRLELWGTLSEPATLYLAEPRYPGWRLYVNGEDTAVEPALGAFVRARVPAGELRAVWRYTSTPWRLGVLLTLAAVLTLAGANLRRLGRSGTF